MALACVLLLAGCTPDGDVLAACEPAERPTLQEGSHLLGDQPPPVPYSSSPPTSGWHSSGRAPDPGAWPDGLTEPAQVLVLEQGGVVVAYDPGLADDQLSELLRLPETVEGVWVTPYEDMPAPVTLTAWGVLQRCDTVSAEDVAAFRDEHAREPAH